MNNLIKWDVDHDYSQNKFMLSGDYNGHRFTLIVLDRFWGIPLQYKRWCIIQRYKALYPEQFKKK